MVRSVVYDERVKTVTPADFASSSSFVKEDIKVAGMLFKAQPMKKRPT